MRRIIAGLVLAATLIAGIGPAIAQAPPVVPALPDTERRTAYSISAATGPYDVGFAVYGDGTDYGNWLEVWCGGTRLTPITDWTLSLASGTLPTASRPLTNARVTLTVARTCTLQIVGAQRPRRLSQFAENRGVGARDLNQVITALTAQNRETWDKTNDVTGRAVIAPPGESLSVLPSAATRANQFLMFDALGNTALNPGISSPTSSIGIGSTPIIGGTDGYELYNNNGVLGNRVAAGAGGIISITDYGAVCSGNIADAPANNTAFINALATGRNVFVPYCSLGYNLGTNSIALSSGQSVTCENQSTVLYGQGAKLFYISSAGPETKVENCTVQMAGGVAGATAFLFKTATSVVNVVTLRNIKCLYVYHCVDDEGTNAVSFLVIDGAYTTQTYGLQFRLRNSNGFVNLRNLNCDFTNEVAIGLVTWGCAEFDNFLGLRVSGLTVATGVGVGTPVFVAGAPAFKFSTGLALWIDGALFADHTAGDGVLIDAVQYLWGDRIEGSINLGIAVTISNSTDGNVANLICFGAVGQVGAAASKTGCDINNVNLINFANIYEKNATGTGVTIRGTSQSLNVANLIATGNTGGGLAVQNSATNINITNGFVGGNTGTAYSNTSSGSVFANFVSGGTQWAQQTAPGSPASGNVSLWFDTTDARFHDKNAAGTIGTTVQPAICTNQFASAVLSTGGVTCTTDVLASAQHANQGTTTTVLHGNAAGNPAWGAIVLTTDVTGALPALNGGTGQASYAIGDLLYASTTTALSRLADVAAGNLLISGGVGAAPAWSSTPTLSQSAAPGSPASGNVILWFDTTDARFHDKNASGTIGTTVQAATCTNQFVSALNAAGGLTCTTDTLAGAQHANQGTTTTLLHGNAAGNPSWGAVGLTTDVTGTLPIANGGTADTGTAWSTWSPTVTCDAGTITTSSTEARYKTLGKTVWYQFSLTITTVGTCTGNLHATLPVNQFSSIVGSVSIETATNANLPTYLQTNKINIITTPASSRTYVTSGVYESS